MASSVSAVSCWCTSVSFALFPSPHLPDLSPVYPETKGVPLEEMDAVFGEEEYEEIMDNASDSDTDSLLTHVPAGYGTIYGPGSSRGLLTRTLSAKSGVHQVQDNHPQGHAHEA